MTLPRLVAFVTSLGLMLASLPAAPSSAQALVVCQARAALVAELARQFGEAPVARGVAANGRLVEVLASEDGRSWTLIVTWPTGESCPVAAGEGWEVYPVKRGRAS